jgi:hypothetical protein
MTGEEHAGAGGCGVLGIDVPDEELDRLQRVKLM